MLGRLSCLCSISYANLTELVQPDGTHRHHPHQYIGDHDAGGVGPQHTDEVVIGKIEKTDQEKRQQPDYPSRHAPLGGQHLDLGVKLEAIADQSAQVVQHLCQVAPCFTLNQYRHHEIAHVSARHSLAEIGQCLLHG